MKLLKKLVTSSSIYVFINIVVCAVGFCRSFVFMKWMNMSDLGVVSLVQTAILFLGLLQFGLINGGYRIFALDRGEEQRSINNLLFSYFALLFVVVTFFWIILVVSNITLAISNELTFIALICGVFSLMMNWLTNTLIGKRLISEINSINLTAALISLLLLPLVIVWGVSGAIISLLAQPLLFVVITLVKHEELRPNAWNFDFKLVKYILTFGFVPFLTGIFTMVNLQIERWSIAEILGTTALGNFYLVFLYSTLFVLVPSSLNSLFFPPSVKAYENKQYDIFKKYLKKYFFILIGYLVIISLLTIFLLQPVVDMVFPKHSSNTIYVYYFLPGLISNILCDPVNLILNALVKLKPMLIVGLVGVFFNLILIVTANKLGLFDLKSMIYIKTFVNILPLICYVIFLFPLAKKILVKNT